MGTKLFCVGAVLVTCALACDNGASGSSGGAASAASASNAAGDPSARPDPSGKAKPAGSAKQATSDGGAPKDDGGSAKTDAAAPEKVLAFEAIHGRGVFYRHAAVGCPNVGIGAPGTNDCLRVGLDDEHSSADIDRTHHKIILRNDGDYKSEKIVADVLLPGWSGVGKDRTAVSVHCVVRKKDKGYSTKVYSHVVTREKQTNVEIEDFEVVLSEAKGDVVLVDKKSALKVVEDPGLSARVAGFLTEVKDNLHEAAPPAGEARAEGDITISIGIGPAAKKALRAQLFHTGADTELRLTTLSGLVPEYVVQRDLFLYGLENATNLGEVKKRGFKSGDTMVLRVKAGKGSVTFGDTTTDLPEAASSMEHFLTTAFVGMVLAHQAKLDTKPAAP